jgi:hypothetical protein
MLSRVSNAMNTPASTLPTVRRGMTVFALVWFGQLVSLTGSGLTEFGLGVWVFQRTGSPVRFALTVLFVSLPRILLSPLAGTLVDRWVCSSPRRWPSMCSIRCWTIKAHGPGPLGASSAWGQAVASA